MWSIEVLWLLLAGLYVVDAITLCEPDETVIVGWYRGTARVRSGVEVWLGRPRMVNWGRLLPPLEPPLIAGGDLFDAEACAARHARLFAELRLLRVLTHLLFVAVFVLLPGALVAPLGWYRPIAAFGLIAVCWVAVVVATIVARRKLCGKDRLPPVAATLLSPVSAIRAVDALVTRAFAAWHPLVVARLLCSREKYVALARAHSHSAAPGVGAVVAFLRSSGDWDEVDAAPAVEHGCNAFCPSCHAQFRDGATDCPDCGVALRAHAVAAGGPASLVAREMTS